MLENATISKAAIATICLVIMAGCFSTPPAIDETSATQGVPIYTWVDDEAVNHYYTWVDDDGVNHYMWVDREGVTHSGDKVPEGLVPYADKVPEGWIPFQFNGQTYYYVHPQAAGDDQN